MSITEKAPQNTKPQTIEQTPRQERPRRRIVPLRYKVGAIGVAAASIAAVAAVKKLDLPTPSIHEELHALPPEVPNGIIATKLGAIGAFAISEQSYQAKAYVRLVNDDGEERETLGYEGDYRMTRAQVGTPTVVRGTEGQKRITLPSTTVLTPNATVHVFHDDETDRDGGEAFIGFWANSQTGTEPGQAMVKTFMEGIARNDTDSIRKTLCVGVAASSQFIDGLGLEGYFTPTYTRPGQDKRQQPDNTRLITVEANYNKEILTVETCAPALAEIGYDPAFAGNMQAGSDRSVQEVAAGMLLPERKVDTKTLEMAYDEYDKLVHG